MAKYILGLDVGKSSLKAVLLEAGLRGGMRIAAWEKVDIAGPAGLREALRRLQEIPIFAVPSCHTALAARHFSFRNVKLPFKDRKKIAQTLPFELDGQIPHPVESVLIDFTVLGQEQGSDLFTAVIPRADVDERVALLSDYAFDAETIYQLLEQEIVPLFYDRDRDGTPRGWVQVMREAIRSNAPLFSTRRMVKQYTTELYLPAMMAETEAAV